MWNYEKNYIENCLCEKNEDVWEYLELELMSFYFWGDPPEMLKEWEFNIFNFRLSSNYTNYILYKRR